MGFIRVARTGWAYRLLKLSLLLACAGFVFASVPRAAGAQSSQPSGPDRYSVTVVDYTKYFWWMFYLGEDDVECELVVDHEGLPTPGDVYVDCGEDLYEKWLKQEPCNFADINRCQGLYVHLVDTKPAQKEISTLLPPPTVQVTLENCDPVYTSSTSICSSEPILVLTGIEPLTDYQITSIEGVYEGQPFMCDAVCRLQLPVTDEDGVVLQFWANSSYGDTSELFDALVRVAVTDAGDPDRLFWYADVLSSQWVGVPVASCVEAWGTLPPVGGPPEWLSTPPLSENLGTAISYNYLAAHLIRTGAVDVSACSDGGLLDGTASNCGMEAAREAVNAWQNQFDSIILSIAKDTGVPAHLLKNMFAIESQFWPGISDPKHVGLGQFTEKGADTALLWNPPFFQQFCPLVMDSAECSKGYLHLSDEQQEYVRLALLNSVNATCETCPLRIDLDRANFSIGVFAHAMLANCEQAGQLVENITGGAAGEQVSYEDLWKFTLVNYNAGPGCLGNALEATYGGEEDLVLNWENVSARLEPACQGAIQYVNSISQTSP
ncbi:MAG TPA: hypothetical protein VK897_13200 [Anaerolineales bacterium]|nr:hypothetical protein [Anaerolineales bacterium]